MKVSYKIIIILLCTGLVFVFCSGTSFAQNGQVPFPSLFVVLVSGNQLPQYCNTPISEIRVVRIINGEFETIPFQIDLRNESGKYLFPGDKGGDRAKLRSSDELVLQGKDLGEKAHQDQLNKLGQGLELKITKNGKTGYVYLGRFDFQKSDKDYVSFKLPTQTITTPRYSLAGHLHNPSYYSKVEIGGVDHVDRAKMRAKASLFFGKINLERNEDDIIGVHDNVIDGQVRLLRRIRYWVKISKNVRSPKLTRVTKSYLAVNDLPNDLSVPFNLDYLFTDLQGVAAFDFDPQIKGAKIYCDKCGDGFLVNGKMDPFEKNDTGLGSRTFSLCSDYGTMIMAVRVTGATNELPIKTRGIFSDDQASPDPPEDVPGKMGMFGYELTDLHKIPKGEYNFHVYLMFPEKCPGAGNSKRVAQEFLGPYDVQINAFGAAQ